MPSATPPVAALRPMLPSLGRMPAGAGWTFEPKWDGFRVLVWVVAGGQARLVSRNGRDLTPGFPDVVAATPPLAPPWIVDGELVALDGGQASFDAIQRRTGRADLAVIERHPALLVVFDVLWSPAGDLTGRPYDERRSALDDLALRGVWQPVLATDRGGELFEASRRSGLEGIVAKRRCSRYRPGTRTRDWIKIKHQLRQEFAVGGYLPDETGRLKALLLGYYDHGGAFVYAGSVEQGLDESGVRSDLAAALEARGRRRSPFAVGGPSERNAVYAEATLVVEIEFSALTPAGRLRHPRYLGVRPDKDAAEVTLEQPESRT